jgi:hypothetical protein
MMENNFLAAHLKNLTNLFPKQNGLFDLKAFMGEAMGLPPPPGGIRRSMDFEDADEAVLDHIRRGSLTPLELDLPRTMPSVSKSGLHLGGSSRSHSNETLPLNEDPMNMVETSWEMSCLNEGESTSRPQSAAIGH